MDPSASPLSWSRHVAPTNEVDRRAGACGNRSRRERRAWSGSHGLDDEQERLALPSETIEQLTAPEEHRFGMLASVAGKQMVAERSTLDVVARRTTATPMTHDASAIEARASGTLAHQLGAPGPALGNKVPDNGQTMTVSKHPSDASRISVLAVQPVFPPFRPQPRELDRITDDSGAPLEAMVEVVAVHRSLGGDVDEVTEPLRRHT